MLFALPAIGAAELRATDDLDPEEVELAISLDKEVYAPGELVRVTSVVKNVGKRTIFVRRPHTVTEAVLHHVDRVVEGKRERAARPQACRSAVGWGPIVELKPGASVSNTCELPHGSTTLWSADEPGQYVLQSNYPRGKSGDVHLNGRVTFSNEVEFRVRPRTETEQRERDELTAAWKTLYNQTGPLPGKYDGDAEPLRVWLRKHPKSRLRLSAYYALQQARWAAEDHHGYADLVREERESGVRDDWSQEWQDHFLTIEVSMLEQQKQLDAAIDALGNSTNPRHRLWRDRLRKQRAETLRQHSLAGATKSEPARAE